VIDLGSLGRALTRDPEGIWVARGAAAISYPEGGHAACLAIEDSSFWFQHRNRCILACVSRFSLVNNGPFFDVGAGNGYVARALAQAGLDVVAIEPGAAGARNARRRGLQHVVCATTDVCGFDVGVAGAVGAFDVVEHMADDLAFLTEMNRLLVPGGLLFVTVPAYAALWSAEDVAAGHHRRYTSRTLGWALARAGFEVEYQSYFFRWLVLPILLLRAVPYRIGLRRKGGDLALNAREHAAVAPGAASRIDALLRREVSAIAAGDRMGFGASLLAVARSRKRRD
jgi:SAM-dependent methyltransferase